MCEQELPIRHLVDVMHTERNISANILKHIFGENDTEDVRKDMEQAGVMPHLWLQPQPDSRSFLQPRAPYVLSESERRSFLRVIATTSTPTGFASSLQKHADKDRLAGLKSHDHHVLLQQIMPAAIRGSLQVGPRNAVIRMGTLFKKICAKVVDPLQIPALLDYAAETLCLFEQHFPPSFFDIMTHLTVHVVEELLQCGPVHSRWCYPVERYMGILASYVRNMARPEASMASGYTDDEALAFATEYFQDFPHSRRRIWDSEEELRDSGELVMGKVKSVTLSLEDVNDIHEYVIRHSEFTAELLG